MEGEWPYCCRLLRCWFLDSNTARSLLEQFPSSLFSLRFVIAHMVNPYSSIDKTFSWKELRFILSDKSNFHMIDSLSIAIHAFTRRIWTSLSVGEKLLPTYVNMSTNLRKPQFKMEVAPSRLKDMYSSLFEFTWRLIPSNACSRLCWDLAGVLVFARRAISALSANVIVSEGYCLLLSFFLV